MRIRYWLFGFFLTFALWAQDKNLPVLNHKQQPYNQQWSFGINTMVSVFETIFAIDEKMYHYKPIVIQGFFNLPLFKKAYRHQLSFYTEPGIFPVVLKPANSGLSGSQIPNYKTSWEAGFTAGFLYNLMLVESLILFMGMGSGPYYFATQNDDHQYKGFLFSDNIVLGLRARVPFLNQKNIEMIFHVRYRHISNAGFFEPNWGIDNVLVGLGGSYLLDKKNKKNKK